MTREDFKKGQTVYIFLVGNAARGKNELDSRIEEHEVISVGRKYITTRNKYNWQIRFNIDRDFREDTEYSVDHVLYLRREDIERHWWRSETKDYIESMMRWDKRTFFQK